MVKVSILIPVYNTEKYLRKCLDSVVNQSLQDIEIIITNDGSKDGSQNIIEEYANKDKRIKYSIQENRGLGATRNKGLELAKGEYIAFLDSDDWVDKNYYRTMYEMAIKENSDLVISSYCIENNYVNKSKRIKCEYKNKEEYFNDLLKGKVAGFSWNKLYKKSLIKDNKLVFPLRGELENVEDQYFSIRCIYKSNKVSFVNSEDIHYRINNNSIVRKYQNNLANDIINLYNKNFILLKNNKNYIKNINQNFVINIINIINNEFKITCKKSFKEKLSLIQEIGKNDKLKNCILEFDEKELRFIDRLYIIFLKNENYKRLYLLAKVRTFLINMKTGVYKSNNGIYE